MPKPIRPMKLGTLSVAKMMRLLVDEPQTVRSLAEHTGLHVRTTGRFARALVKEEVIHIGGWRKDIRGADSIPVYHFGPGKTAKRSKMTPTERKAKSRAKMRALENIRRFAGTLEVTHE